jgi:hypothetical protein
LVPFRFCYPSATPQPHRSDKATKCSGIVISYNSGSNFFRNSQHENFFQKQYFDWSTSNNHQRKNTHKRKNSGSGRFRGVSSRAANWIHVESITGRGRDGEYKHAILPIKDIYLCPLTKNFKVAVMTADFSEVSQAGGVL